MGPILIRDYPRDVGQYFNIGAGGRHFSFSRTRHVSAHMGMPEMHLHSEEDESWNQVGT